MEYINLIGNEVTMAEKIKHGGRVMTEAEKQNEIEQQQSDLEQPTLGSEEGKIIKEKNHSFGKNLRTACCSPLPKSRVF